MQLLLYLLATLWLSATLAFANVLAPRASAVPVAYYRAPYQCATSLAAYRLFTEKVTPSTGGGLITCAYTSGSQCNYNLATGMLTTGAAGCGTTTPQRTGCSYECPISTTAGSPFTSSLFNAFSYELDCNYSNPAATCSYYTITGQKYGASTNCPTLAVDCGATPSRRRQYRREDNHTAWLAHRAERELRSPAEPVPGPLPRRSR